MAVNVFDNYTVLVVEDHFHIRGLLSSIIKSFGYGSVLSVHSFDSAVSMITDVKNNPAKVGVSGIDIVLIDKVLSPNGEGKSGIDLTRWIRWSPDSIDNMMRTILISSFFDMSNAWEGPEVGAHSSLVKPFTSKAIYQHLLAVINDNRHFFRSDDYFGPDRQRAQEIFDAKERRLGKKLTALQPIRPRDIRSKMFGNPKDAIKEEDFADIDKQMSESNNQIDSEFKTLYESLMIAYDNLNDAIDNEQDPHENLKILSDAAFGLRGSSLVFSYPMIGILNQYLNRICKLADSSGELDNFLRLIDIVVDAVSMVYKNKICGYGGTAGVKIVEEIERILSRLQAKIGGEEMALISQKSLEEKLNQ